MKNFILLLCLLVGAVCLCGCAGIPCEKTSAAEYQGKKIKTAFYVDRGSNGGGVLHLARLLSYSPQLDVTLVHGEDLRNGKLKDFELLVMPGGSSKTQMVSMGEKGVEALRDFVRNGGSYVGVCAGFHITLNRKERARLLPYTYVPAAVGYRANVFMDLSDDGAKVLDVKAGRYLVTYSRGPIAKPEQWDQGKCRTLALYKSSVGPVNRVGKSFFNTPALIYGNFGKGKVIATSFHPEYRMETYELLYGCVYAVTGKKMTPVFPEKKFPPYRVLYYSGIATARGNRFAIKDILELEKSPEIAVNFSLSLASLDSSDIVVLPEGDKNALQGLEKSGWLAILTKFMDKGGKVLAVGSAWDKMPAHANLTRVPAKSSLVDGVLRAAQK